MVQKVRPIAKFVVSHTSVTSPKKKVNLRDQLVAWLSSALVTIGLLGTQAIKLISQLLDSITDYVLPYLQQVPRQDRPVWLAGAAFVAMGLIVLNKRRLSGPSYTPPPPMPFSNDLTVTPTVAVQTPPPPPGASVDTSKKAF